MKIFSSTKNNHKMFIGFFLLAICAVVVACIAIPTGLAQAAPSKAKSTSNEALRLCLTGPDWGWNDGPELVYNESSGLYEKHVTFNSSSSEWKIKEVGEGIWDINYGGTISYIDNHGQFKGTLNGDNLLSPNQLECDIYLKYVSNEVAYIGVNMIPEYKEVNLHSNDNESLFKYFVDGADKAEVATATEYFFHDECVKLYVDDNYEIDGIKTSALIAENADGSEKHAYTFKIDLGSGYQYVDPSRVTHVEDATGHTKDVTLWVNEIPVPQQQVDITCTGNEPFQYFNGVDWTEVTSFVFKAANEGKDITIYNDETINEGVVVISDGYDNLVKIKSAFDGVVLNTDRVLFDDTNFKIFFDYNDFYTYSVKAQDDKGSILPGEEFAVDTFGDCKYVIDENKITLSLGTFAKEYTASAADENTFEAWLDAQGNKITKTEGYLYDFDVNGDVEFVASFTSPDIPTPPDPVNPLEEIVANVATGDSNVLIVMMLSALLTGGILFARRKFKINLK